MATTVTMTTKVITIDAGSYSTQLSTQNYIITPYVVSIMHMTLSGI